MIEKRTNLPRTASQRYFEAELEGLASAGA